VEKQEKKRKMISAVGRQKIGRIKEKLEILLLRNDKDPILEFGVFEGFSLSEIYLFLLDNDMENKVFGFDSFDGIPQDEGMWKKGEAKTQYSAVMEMIKEKVKDTKNIEIVKGLFDDTLNAETMKKHNIDKVSFIHIDSDLYTSCVAVLDFCKSLLKVGTFIVFDEWPHGEGVAWEEFVNENTNIGYNEMAGHNNQKIIEITRV